MDELLHLGHDSRLRWRHVLPIRDVYWAAGKFIDRLPQDPHALPHLLDAHQITIVTIACTANHHVEVVLAVIEIRMFPPQIVFDPASAQVWAGEGISNRALLRDDANVPGAIHENFVPGQQPVALVQARLEIVEEFFQLWNELLRQITDLPAHARVGSGKSRAGEQLEKIIKFFALGERVKENRHRPKIERHRAEPQQVRSKWCEWLFRAAECPSP